LRDFSKLDFTLDKEYIPPKENEEIPANLSPLLNE
jgi:hypothetical protein